MEMEKTTIYIGEVIKNVMVEKLVTKAELARRLQVKPQSVDYMLTRKSIDTDTLYNVSKALDYDFALLYSIDKEQMNYDRENEAYKLSTAKILIELELKPDEHLYCIGSRVKVRESVEAVDVARHASV